MCVSAYLVLNSTNLLAFSMAYIDILFMCIV
jgi:hypothetical protein